MCPARYTCNVNGSFFNAKREKERKREREKERKRDMKNRESEKVSSSIVFPVSY